MLREIFGIFESLVLTALSWSTFDDPSALTDRGILPTFFIAPKGVAKTDDLAAAVLLLDEASIVNADATCFAILRGFDEISLSCPTLLIGEEIAVVRTCSVASAYKLGS